MRTAAHICLRHLTAYRRTAVTTRARSLAVRTMASGNNSYHVLQYSYVPDILEKRGPYRGDHLEGAKRMASEDKLVMAGALTDPVDGAIFIFRNMSKEEIEAFVKADPYVVNGLVPKWTIRPYAVVAGDRD